MPDEEPDELLDEETIDHLVAVRKGKPRRFVMIVKGAQVVSLVVYKKGNLNSYRKQAKEGGRGEIYHGVVDGRGTNINFKLARADGYDRPPVKTAVLRQFLDERADLKFRPLIEIIDEPSLVLDTDDPLTSRFVQLRDAALHACDEHPDRAKEINRICREIGRLLDEDEASNDALKRIEGLERLLEELHFGDAPARRDSDSSHDTGKLSDSTKKRAPPAPPPPPDPATLKLKAQLAQLLKRATPHAPTIGKHVKSLAKEANELAAAEKHDEAKQRMAKIGELIFAAREAEQRKADAKQYDEFKTHLKEIKGSLDELKSFDSPDAKLAASEVATLLRQAAERAAAKKFENAIELLDEAKAKLDAESRLAATANKNLQVAGSDKDSNAQSTQSGRANRDSKQDRTKSRAGIVAIAKLKFLWDEVVSSFERAVANLELAASEVLETDEFEGDPRLEEARAKVRGIGERMPEITGVQTAMDRLIDGLNTSDDERRRERLMEQTMRAIRGYRTELDSEPMFQLLQRTPAGEYPIYDHFAASLDRLAAALRE